MAGEDRSTVRVRDLSSEEAAAAVSVLARGMRDNPLHVAAFGTDPERRRRSLERMFTSLFRIMGAQEPLCALDGETIVGVTGVAPPGTCQPEGSQRLRLLFAMLGLGPAKAMRVGRWVSAWGARDPERPHSHLGPLAVDAELQGRGIGTQILREYTRRLDEAGQLAYLETDKAENVPLYERHGFQVVGEAPVLDVPNWFMRREPR